MRALAVDLDGTLMRGDSFLLACGQALKRQPWKFVKKAREGLAALKEWMYPMIKNEEALRKIKWNVALMAWLKMKRAQGVGIYLVSAAPEFFLQEVVKIRSLSEIFDGVRGSAPGMNLRGAAKAQALVEKFGEKGFDYIGNSQADVPVWRECATAYNVNPSRALIKGAKAAGVELQMIAENPQHWLMEAWDNVKRARGK